MKVELSFKHHKGAIQFKISLSFFFFFKRAVSLLHCKLDNVCHHENQWHKSPLDCVISVEKFKTLALSIVS